MAYYKDLRDYIQTLEKNDKLVRIKREINKDTELHPLGRWQFLCLPEKERKAFLFENVIDSKGKHYESSVILAAHAPSREIYSLALGCEREGIMEKWETAQANPIKPMIVSSGPVQEEVHMGDGLLEHGGLDEFPVPISTPGFDNGPYLTAGNWLSKDPDTGVYNIGNYRGMVKSQTRIGCNTVAPQHLRLNRDRYKEKGFAAMPAAVIIGPTPNIGLVSVTKIPYELSEYDVAGGLAGEPVQLVKCKTVDLLVPATAEIVIEGEISTEYLEKEGPFGEYTGYIGRGIMNPFFNVSCITHRKNPVWNAFLSQFPPSESSLLTTLGLEARFFKFIKEELSLPNLLEVAFHNESSGRQLLVIRLNKPTQYNAWQALNGAATLMPQYAKIIIAVDEDIDPHDLDRVAWALCFRMQPDRDLRVTPGKIHGLDPSAVPQDVARKQKEPPATSSVMINATRKWDYPPVSLPKKEFMEKARIIWEEEGLPPLKDTSPWHGYSLGYWTDEDIEEAELALKGEHYKTGKKLKSQRVKG
jgi:UbiD family decarboxylase